MSQIKRYAQDLQEQEQGWAMEYEEDLERLILPYSPKFRAVLAAARQQIPEGKGIEPAAFWGVAEGEVAE